MSRPLVELRVLSRTNLSYPSRRSSSNPRPVNLLQPLCALFTAPVLSFQQLAASFCKTSGVGVSLQELAPCTEAQKCPSVSPLPATLTHSVSRKSFPCHSYANTRDRGVTPTKFFLPLVYPERLWRRATRHSPLTLTPFRINTCKSVSKQTTLTSFRINTYEKHRGEGGRPVLLPPSYAPRNASIPVPSLDCAYFLSPGGCHSLGDRSPKSKRPRLVRRGLCHEPERLTCRSDRPSHSGCAGCSVLRRQSGCTDTRTGSHGTTGGASTERLHRRRTSLQTRSSTSTGNPLRWPSPFRRRTALARTESSGRACDTSAAARTGS